MMKVSWRRSYAECDPAAILPDLCQREELMKKRAAREIKEKGNK
jgi:hypothetical protein